MTDKVICPSCLKTVSLRKDGLMREHISNVREWPGSPFNKRCPLSSTRPEKKD